MLRALLILSMTIFFAPFWVGAGVADEYPEKPITIIVPFGPGGGGDTNAQLFKRAIDENDLLDQPIVIKHIPGAGGNIGAKEARDTDADGYTYLQTIISLATNRALGNIDFGPLNFEAVAVAGDSCMVISVMEDSPYTTLDGLLASAKDNPDTITLGINVGGVNHITARMLEAAAGAKFRLVNVGGGADNFASLVGGHTETTPFSASDFSRFRSKGIRGLAYTGAERHPSLPEIPTTAELGYSDIDFCFAHWWLAPKGTPADRIEVFAKALEAAFDTDLVQKQWEALAMTPRFSVGDAAATRIEKESQAVQNLFAK